VFEREIRRIFGSEMEAIEFWRKLYYDDFYDLYFLPVIKTVRSREMIRETRDVRVYRRIILSRGGVTINGFRLVVAFI
jgi:hypothetical protein